MTLYINTVLAAEEISNTGAEEVVMVKPWLASANDYLTLGLLIVGILSFGALVWYTVLTYKLAKITQQAYLLDRRPYLAYKQLDLLKKVNLQDKLDQQIKIVLENVGKVPLNYTVKEITVSIDGATHPNPTFVSMGGSISPGSTGNFKYPFISTMTPSKGHASSGEVEYYIEYTSIGSEIYTLRRKTQFQEIPPDRIETLDLDSFET